MKIFKIFVLVILKNWALTFLIKNVCDSLLNLATLFQTRTKAKKNTLRIRIQSITVVKTTYQTYTYKWIEVKQKMENKKENRCKTFNKPEYFGMCILDLNKVLMFELHYDYIKTKYDETQDYY